MSEDPRLRIPDDLEQIATSMPPAGRGLSSLRRLIGILPNPLSSTQPRQASEEGGGPPSDPQAQLESGVGSQHGTGAIHEQTMNPGVVPGSAIIPGTVGGGAIAAGAITATSIAADSITANHIQANAVTASELAANSVTADEIAANSINAGDIVAGAITANDIATGTITGVQLADGTVSDVKIASGLSATKITTGTLSAVTITACDITAGGGGFDGFEVVNGSGSSVGSWTSGGFGTSVAAVFTTTLSVGGYLDATTVGVGTRVVAGAFSNVPPNTAGQLGIDSSNNRFYYYHSGGWHYSAGDAGFGIPEWERLCPACGAELLVDAPVIGRITDIQGDGARHGLYVHLACAERPMQPELVAHHLEASAAGISGGPEQAPSTGSIEAAYDELHGRAQAGFAEQRAALARRDQFAEEFKIIEADLEREANEEHLAEVDRQRRELAERTVTRAKPREHDRLTDPSTDG